MKDLNRLFNDDGRRIFIEFIIYITIFFRLSRDCLNSSALQHVILNSKRHTISKDHLKWLSRNFRKLKIVSFDVLQEDSKNLSFTIIPNIHIKPLYLSCYVKLNFVFLVHSYSGIVLAKTNYKNTHSILKVVMKYINRFKEVQIAKISFLGGIIGSSDIRNFVKNYFKKYFIKVEFVSKPFLIQFIEDIDLFNLSKLHKKIDKDLAIQYLSWAEFYKKNRVLVLYKPPMDALVLYKPPMDALVLYKSPMNALVLHSSQHYIRENENEDKYEDDINKYIKNITFRQFGKDIFIHYLELTKPLESEINNMYQVCLKLFFHSQPYTKTKKPFKILYVIKFLEDYKSLRNTVFDPQDFEQSIEILTNDLAIEINKFIEEYNLEEYFIGVQQKVFFSVKETLFKDISI
jgi:hypothetical protein